MFIGFWLIGASSYRIFQHFTRVPYVLSESEKWLARRRQATIRSIKRRKVLIQWVLWSPTCVVILLCILMDYAWAFGSHVFHPRAGTLLRYELSFPFTWSIAYNDSSDKFSIIVAERYRGLIKAGSGAYLGRQRPFLTSHMNFRNMPSGELRNTEPANAVISIQTLPFADESIVCKKEVLPRWTTSGQYIRCLTPSGDFSASFSGADEDVIQFYRVLGSVKRRN